MNFEIKPYSKSGRTFSHEEIRIMQETVKEKFHTNRCEISRTVCKKLDWFSENGKPKQWVCRELLIQLERDGLVILPAPMPKSFNRFKKKKFQTELIVLKKNFAGKLNEFPKPSFKRVLYPAENTFWEYLVDKYHYLGYKGVMGRFLKYIVYIEDVPIACLGWTGAALRVTARDNWIGWDTETKKRELKHISNQFRFVIFPWVKIKYLASHLLSKNIPMLVKDWKKQYNVDIFLLETFVDKEKFLGTSYKAANWVKVGETKGYAKKKTGYSKHGKIKEVYLYPIRQKG